MSDKYVLVSFVGGHDLKRVCTANNVGPLEKIIKEKKPVKIYLLISSEYEKEFKEKNLKSFYENILEDSEVVDKETGIIDPTNCKEIANKISNIIEEINDEREKNNWKIYVNLTSGTPAMIAVLALAAITGQLNWTKGVYAPNPAKKDENINAVNTSALDFYKNSFAYKTLKKMINSYDYIGVDEFVNNKTYKGILKNEFINLVKFARAKQVCNFTEAYEYYQKLEDKKFLEFKVPENSYEEAKEFYLGIQSAIRQKDDFQAIIKTAILRENIIKYIIDGLIKEQNIDIIEEVTNENTTKTERKIRSDESTKQKYNSIYEKLEKANVDLTRPLGAWSEDRLAQILIEQSDDDRLINMNRDCFSPYCPLGDSLRGCRNSLAHVMTAPEYNEKWEEHIKTLMKYVCEYFRLASLVEDEASIINKKLISILNDIIK